MRKELESLVKFLEMSAEKSKKEAETAGCNYLKGYANGTTLTYELCAKWITEALEKEG